MNTDQGQQPKKRGRPPKQPPAEPIKMIENSITATVQSMHQIKVHDVVQVYNQTSSFYGVLFQIGDIQKGKAHGFYMLPGGRKEFATVGVDECRFIGESRVRSKEPTSQQWKLECESK